MLRKMRYLQGIVAFFDILCANSINITTGYYML